MNGKIFALIAWSALAIKLWVTSEIMLASVEAPFDYTDFLRHAEQLVLGNWFGPYDNSALIKGPAIELFLAAIREFGIPLPLAHQVFYALASFLVVVAIRPLVRSGWWLGFIFAIVLFNPATFDADAWILNRSQIFPIAAVAFAACGIGAIVRARSARHGPVVWLVAFGLSAACVWLTREDTVWIFPAVAAFLASYLWFAGAFSGRLRSVRAALVVAPILTFCAAVGTIMALNDANYGWATTVETTAPEFVSAYQSLSRIELPGVDNRIYPAPAAARNLAYAVSPAAAELKPYFDPGNVWKSISCSQLSLCDDVSSGWFVWAFRDAVEGAGYYTSGTKARDFYIRLSRELDAACDAKRLTCRGKSLSLAPALRLSDIPGTLRFTLEALWHAAAYDQFVFGGLPPISASAETVRPVYQSVAGSAELTSYVFRGWILHKRGGSVHVETPSPNDFTTYVAYPSPDVRAAYGKAPEFAADDLENARFVIAASCLTGCVVVVDDGPGRVARIPLNGSTNDVRAAGVVYHLDSEFTDPPTIVETDWKLATQTQIVTFYRQIVRIWFVFVVLVFVVRAIRAGRGRRPAGVLRTYAFVGSTAVALLANCVVLGLVSAVSFYALYPEYESALFPLLLICLATATAIEGETLIRFVRSRLRPRIAPVSAAGRSPLKDAS